MRLARAFLALALAALASAPGARAEWTFCAPEGGHCSCFGEMRYGHPGQPHHLANDGAWFAAHPEVRRWAVKEVSGAEVACVASAFDGGDPFPGLDAHKFCQCNVPEALAWRHCADGGETCDCAALASASESESTAEGRDAPGSRARPRSYLIRATDADGAYYGATLVGGPAGGDVAFRCPEDFPGARCECLAPAPAPPLAWDWCANEGGHCPCTTRMRFGHTGTAEMYRPGGYFEAHPEVRRWIETTDLPADADASTACALASFRSYDADDPDDSNNHRESINDPFPDAPGPKICQCEMPVRVPGETVLAWKWCANEGGECAGCDTAARFGATGEPGLYASGFFDAHPEVTRWSVRGDAPGTVTCDARSFSDGGGEDQDPFPGRAKICQCLREVPRPRGSVGEVRRATEIEHTEWSWCGEDGATCACDGLVRYGATGDAAKYANGGAWFKAHPEVMKWTYLRSYGELECGAKTFGFDPFPDQKKICQCLPGYDEQFPYRNFRPRAISGSAARLGARPEPNEGEGAGRSERSGWSGPSWSVVAQAARPDEGEDAGGFRTTRTFAAAALGDAEAEETTPRPNGGGSRGGVHRASVARVAPHGVAAAGLAAVVLAAAAGAGRRREREEEGGGRAERARLVAGP